MSLENPTPGPEMKRWLMFLISPTDVLGLLKVVSNPLNKFAAGSLPPDVRIEDAFYDDEQNYLGLMLESDYFDPVEVHRDGNQLSAAWPRAVFTMQMADPGESPDDEMWGEAEMVSGRLRDEAKPDFMAGLSGAMERGRHLRALNFSGQDLLDIVRSNSVRELPVFPAYKDDTRILGTIVNNQIKGWTIFLEHPDFEIAKASQEDDMVFVEVEGDGHDLSFRFGLPGAKIQRKWEVLEE